MTSPEPTQRLTDERLARIKARSDAFRKSTMGNGMNAAYDSAADVPRLLAELSRLRAELDSMTQFAESLRAERDRSVRSCGELGVELDRLRAENTAMAAGVLGEVAAERAKQETKWGEQNHPDLDPHDIDTVVRNEYAFRADRWKEVNALRAKEGCEVKHRDPEVPCTAWDGVLLEEVYEALAEDDPAKVRTELVQTAAVAVAWIEAIDRRASDLSGEGQANATE